MAVPATMRIPLPPGAEPVAVAGGLNPAFSSWLPLNARAAEIGALGTVLILGVTGMAGLLAVQHAGILSGTRSQRAPAGRLSFLSQSSLSVSVTFSSASAA
jgi:hypothetical protein